jgi:similar to spore coat protein
MDSDLITPSESLHLHEIISFKVLCATKSSAMKTLVKDEELKKLMEQDVAVSKEHLEDLKKLIIDSPFLVDDDEEEEEDDDDDLEDEEDDIEVDNEENL